MDNLTGKKLYTVFDKNSTKLEEIVVLESGIDSVNQENKSVRLICNCRINGTTKSLFLNVKNDAIFLDDGGRAFERKAEALSYLVTQIDNQINERHERIHELLNEIDQVNNDRYLKYEGVTLIFADTHGFNVVKYHICTFQQCKRDVATYIVEKYINGVLFTDCCHVLDIDFSKEIETFFVPSGYVRCNHVKEAEDVVLKALNEFYKQQKHVIFNAINNAKEVEK